MDYSLGLSLNCHLAPCTTVPQSHSLHIRNSFLPVKEAANHIRPSNPSKPRPGPVASLSFAEPHLGLWPSWHLGGLEKRDLELHEEITIPGLSNGKWEEEEGKHLAHSSQSANQFSACAQADRGFVQGSAKSLQKFPVEPSQNTSLGQPHSERGILLPRRSLGGGANSDGKREAESVLPTTLADFDLMTRTFEKLFIPWQCRSSYRNKHRSINLGAASSIQ